MKCPIPLLVEVWNMIGEQVLLAPPAIESPTVPTPSADGARSSHERDQFMDMTDEWGMQSFPASDPPQNW
jgi:hypothetical protein